ncbi:hypothetical protein QSV34_03850 [Porticoccus sp. W117]|uniref:hypothetical protein n=1 Tax=Porticoccus sp. W117 TaxID=3054777 RepID=UPI0025982EA3|nr:hypothetical protein [Porticoccus sp. W117]MDM3870486.1 hypothetical protein [Porticoccus sp. W117]
MAGIHIKIRKPWRRALYGALATSWCSGIGFFILSRWVRIEGDFGPERHPLQFPLLQLHGGAAFVMMMFLGALFVGHVAHTWPAKKRHPMGVAMAIVVALMVISAWLLYYLANEDVRAWVANIHASLGLLLPVLLAIHIQRARRKNVRPRRDGPAVCRSIQSTS